MLRMGTRISLSLYIPVHPRDQLQETGAEQISLRNLKWTLLFYLTKKNGDIQLDPSEEQKLQFNQ